YDAAGNLNYRTNNALLGTFRVNSLNELTNVGASGTLTVAGTTSSPATNVTVWGSTGLASGPAALYADSTWARTNATLPNGTVTYTATAQDSYGRQSTNSVTVNLHSSASYAYDANGNLLSDGTRTFAYDDENQLVTVYVTNVLAGATNVSRSDFVYDGRMRRRERFESALNGAAWLTNTGVFYVYDGNLVVQERNAGNLPAVTYTRGIDLSGSFQGAGLPGQSGATAGGIGGLLARSDNTTLATLATAAHAYYHADGNGNITCLISSSNAVTARYLYDPFGRILSQSGPLAAANVYRFSSKELHVNSGLYYYLYRFYDPSLQRWPNRDPLGEAGFEAETRASVAGPPGLFPGAVSSTYSFVDNRAGNAIDPLGLMSPSDCGALLRKAAALIEQAEAEPWNSLALNAQAERLLSIWARFCQPPPSGPPSPAPRPIPIRVPPHNPPFCANYTPSPTVKKTCFWATVGVVSYWVCSEGSRVLFPPRNLVPVL
ncbi:MAG: RHS repeat-associated core domain-containing protein, partial [Limisphaerales bacterium]